MNNSARFSITSAAEFRTWARLCVLILFGALCAGPSVTNAGTAAALIDTHAAWNGTSAFGIPLGEPESAFAPVATYGQTIRVPSGTPWLESFSIWLSDSPAFDPDPLRFGFYVMEWSGTHAMGEVLYDSGLVTTSVNPVASWAEYRFDHLGLQLQPERSYVMILSTSLYMDGIASSVYVGSPFAADAYADGCVATLNNLSDVSRWTTEDWQVSELSWDTVFQAQFTVLPEPSTALLLVIGTFALGVSVGRGHRRRQP